MLHIVIIDNGQDYSNNAHWVGCVCKTEEEAKLAVVAFEAWKAALLADKAAGIKQDEAYCKAHPCPLDWSDFGHWELEGWYGLGDYTATPAKTPEWRNGKLRK